MKKTNKQIVALLLCVGGLAACTKDNITNNDDVNLPKPSISNVEIGLNNNEIGVIGRDFHFNADIVAGDKIDLAQVKIQQREDETYVQDWNHEVTWEQYKGARNSNVHKHFNIPDDAVEGEYDFLIIVTDENGTKLEEKRTINIYAPENLPIDPQLSGFAVIEVDENHTQTRRVYNVLLPDNFDPQVKKNQIISSFGNVSGIKGDGKIYFLIINKKHNHRPETIEAIDFSKAIVSDVSEHKDFPETIGFTSLYDYSTNDIRQPAIVIGAENDNNLPSNPIAGAKAWETGDYYFGVVYHNSTYNIGLFKYIEVAVSMD